MTIIPLVTVERLQVDYVREGIWRTVIRDLDLVIERGEAIGLAGESGCGKSTLASLLLGEQLPGRRIAGGRILFDGHDLFRTAPAALRSLRGSRIGIVPQNGGTTLTPTRRIGSLFDDVLRTHRPALSASQRADEARIALEQVGIPGPARALGRFPHQFSGGQQQRVSLALALVCNPELLVLDEPTTGQDAVIRRMLIALLREIRQRLGTTILFVSHDLLTLAEICDRINVMSGGHIVESAPAATILSRPTHAYTRRLAAAVPRIDRPPEGWHTGAMQGWTSA